MGFFDTINPIPWGDKSRMLQFKNILLRPVSSDDLPLLYEWINDREQVLLNATYKPISLAQHQNWFQSIQQRQDMVLFGIQTRRSQTLIGTCQLHSIHPIHRCAELQIRIGDVSARGKGYGTEAVGLLLHHAFQDLHLHRVYLHVFSHNAPAIRVYEKAGFVREGVQRQAAYIDGRYVDVVTMGILYNEQRLADMTQYLGEAHPVVRADAVTVN